MTGQDGVSCRISVGQLVRLFRLPWRFRVAGRKRVGRPGLGAVSTLGAGEPRGARLRFLELTDGRGLLLLGATGWGAIVTCNQLALDEGQLCVSLLKNLSQTHTVTGDDFPLVRWLHPPDRAGGQGRSGFTAVDAGRGFERQWLRIACSHGII